MSSGLATAFAAICRCFASVQASSSRSRSFVAELVAHSGWEAARSGAARARRTTGRRRTVARMSAPRLRQQRESDHLVQQARPDVRVPLDRAGRDFAQIEADDALAAAADGAQEADGLA